MWEKKYTTDDNGCWLWNGYLNTDGYAVTYVAEGVMVHRVLYIRLVGPIPAGMELDHLCRVRRCVNPAHMEPVTHLENHRRSAVGILTEADVVAIRRSSESTRELAQRYGVAEITLSQARSGRSWKAVAEPPGVPPRFERPLKTHCPRGHEKDLETRTCKPCRAERERARRRRAAEARGLGRAS